MNKRLLGLVAIPLLLATTSCFTLQGFMVLNAALAPTKTTTARFTVHPHLASKNPGYSTAYQFALVGVATGVPSGNPAVSVGKATWGANGKFGGPQSMPVSTTLAGAIDASGDCNGSGFDFSTLSSSVTWKGFITLNKVADKQKVGTPTTIDIRIKAIAAAASGDIVFVVGVTGAWIDTNTSGTVDSGDEFDCTGNATTFINIV